MKKQDVLSMYTNFVKKKKSEGVQYIFIFSCTCTKQLWNSKKLTIITLDRPLKGDLIELPIYSGKIFGVLYLTSYCHNLN